MATLCAVNLAVEAFPLGAIAQTSVARVNAVIAHHTYAEAEVFSIFCDISYADYLYGAMAEAASQFQ